MIRISLKYRMGSKLEVLRILCAFPNIERIAMALAFHVCWSY